MTADRPAEWRILLLCGIMTPWDVLSVTAFFHLIQIMKTSFKNTLIAATVTILSTFSAIAAVNVGQPAPDFTLTDTLGRARSLSEFKGKVIVLEWVNPSCPFVIKHYGSGNMQKLQKTYSARGVVWLSINSGAPGKEGSCTPDQACAWVAKEGAAPTALLPDPTGKVGHLYGASNTPHLFIIGQNGNVVYEGAIDSIRSARQDDVPKATNYVAKALDEILAGKSVSKSQTTPYGCSVKY
jgi:peroxiredoxin